jgi:hypothetical protein
MRTRLCNAVDEEKSLQAVRDTAAFQSALESNDGVHTTRKFEVEESTRHLRDRLKCAGDDELLNDDKKDDFEVKGDSGKLSNDDKKDEIKANEGDDEKSLFGIQKDNREGKKEDEEKILTKMGNVIGKEDDDQEVNIYDKKESVPLNEIGDDMAVLI